MIWLTLSQTFKCSLSGFVALAVLAATVLVVAPATTARASNSYLCESSGSYCVGSAGTAWGDPVVERNPNGREITWVADGGLAIP